MKESAFIQKNSNRWREVESMLQTDSKLDPDYVYELFIQLTDDLAYARTYFPLSQSVSYLNDLAAKMYHIIYKNKKLKTSKFVEFWKYRYPMVIAQHMRYIALSLAIILLAFFIGFLSARHDSGFIRLIMGDSYINMTLENIANGDPLAVYKKMNQTEGFILIAVNNIYVSFLAFVGGILLAFGTVLVLVQNGIMLGAFLYLFYEKQKLGEALSVVFIHGTLEIFSIVVAGAAGMVMGSSILLTGTYRRIDSFKHGVGQGLRMVAGLVPVFILAAFLEGFVTRYTEMPDLIKIFIILLSLIFIFYYFYWYPQNIKNKHRYGQATR